MGERAEALAGDDALLIPPHYRWSETRVDVYSHGIAVATKFRLSCSRNPEVAHRARSTFNMASARAIHSLAP
jgi:hypothetical protein